MMKTEKRKANVGERILITNPELTGGYYGKGDVLSVIKTHSNTVVTLSNTRWIRHNEYEVIIETPKKSARITALETQVATLQAKVEALEAKQPTLSRGEEAGVAIRKALDKLATKTVADVYPLTAQFERESADIERKAKPTLEALLATYPTPNEQRADVIRYAKHYVKSTVRIVGMNLYGPDNRVQFVVNTEKRTVVALTRMYESGDIIRKGIAKCDPDDVFNADIGKAIALARALGVNCPTEFVKAVQPTEVVIGHVVKDGYGPCANGKVSKLTPTISRQGGGYNVVDGGWSYVEDAVIIEDTDAVYE